MLLDQSLEKHNYLCVRHPQLGKYLLPTYIGMCRGNKKIRGTVGLR